MNTIHEQQSGLYSSPQGKWVLFFFVAVGVVTVTYGVLFLVDFLPEKRAIAPVAEEIVQEEVASEPEVAEAFPLSIIFDSLNGKAVKILNPESTSVDDLDTALLSGVVRHPESADFRDVGTIFLLGHSSYLPVVNNKNFQAFNGIQKLTWGDTIRLQSSDTEYVYSVDRVYETKASEAQIEIEKGIAKLVLATCNSFATKDDRYIVEATLVSSYPI